MPSTPPTTGQCWGSRKVQVKKQSLQAAINAKLVTASSLGPVQVISTIAEYLPQMKLVNLSTSMHRLAKLEADGGLPVWGVLTCRVTSVLKGMPEEDERLPRALSNIVWSLAAVQRWDAPLMHIAVPMATMHLRFFKPFELAMFLWGVAKLGAADHMPENITDLFLKAGVHAADTACNFEFRSLSMVAWAYATVNIHHGCLFQRIAAQMCSTVQMSNSGELANAAWAFGKLRHRDQRLFMMLAEAAVQRAENFKAHEAANVLWGIVRNGFFHEQLVVKMLGRSAELDLQPQQLTSILWVCSRLRDSYPGVCAACLPLLPRCGLSLEALSPGDFSMRLQTIAKIFRNSSELGGRKLHTSLLGFFAAAVPCTLRHLRAFSEQSLVCTAVALQTLGLGDLRETQRFVLVGLEMEVLRRAKDMTPAQVISMLCVFMASSSQSCAVHRLAARLVGLFNILSPQDLQELGKVYLASEQLPRSQTPTREAIFKWCCSLRGSPSADEGGRPEGTTGHTCRPPADEVVTGVGPGHTPGHASVFLVKNTFIEVAGADAEMDQVRLSAKRFLSERPRRKVHEAYPWRPDIETSSASSRGDQDSTAGRPVPWSRQTSESLSTPATSEKFHDPPLWSSEVSTSPATPDARGKPDLQQPDSNRFHLDASGKTELHHPHPDVPSGPAVKDGDDLRATGVGPKDLYEPLRGVDDGQVCFSGTVEGQPVGGSVYPVILGAIHRAVDDGGETARSIHKAWSGPRSLRRVPP